MVRGLQKQGRKKKEPLNGFGLNGAYHLFAEGCLKIIKNDLLFRLQQLNIPVSKSKRPFIIRTAWKAGILDAKDLIIIRQIWKTTNRKFKGDKINMENIHEAIEYLRQFILKGYKSSISEQFERA